MLVRKEEQQQCTKFLVFLPSEVLARVLEGTWAVAGLPCLSLALSPWPGIQTQEPAVAEASHIST